MDQWHQFIKRQESELGEETVEKWLKPLKVVRFDARNLYLEANDMFQILWFEEHVRSKIDLILLNNNKQPIKVHLGLANPSSKNKKLQKTSKVSKNSDVKKSSEFKITFQEIDSLCQFDNFIIEASNVVPVEVLKQCITQSQVLYNPIYIYGKSGAGKSHLLMASMLSFKLRGINVVYAHAQEFTNHVVSAIRAGEMNIFRQAYRNVDVLIIDDVHIFSKKSATQEEFFHGFNALHIAGKQMILSANCHPSELDMIEARLISRFEWGLVLPLEIPSKKAKMDILLSRSEAIKFPLEDKLCEFLVDTFSSTKSMIKALEILALRSHLSTDHHKGNSITMTVATAKHLLHDFLLEDKSKAITPDHILQAVSEHFGLRVEDLLGKVQTRDHVLPRQVAMYLCRHTLKLPYAKIGHLFTKDHSTVMSSVKLIQKSLDTGQPDVANAYHLIAKKFA